MKRQRERIERRRGRGGETGAAEKCQGEKEKMRGT